MKCNSEFDGIGQSIRFTHIMSVEYSVLYEDELFLCKKDV